MKNKLIIIFSTIFLVVFVVLAAYLYSARKQVAIDSGVSNNKVQQSEQKNQVGGSWNFDLIRPVFAQIEEAAKNIKPSIPYNKPKFDELKNLNNFIEGEGVNFSSEQKDALEGLGFFLAKNDIIGDQTAYDSQDDFADIYKNFSGQYNKYYREGQDSVFISSDFMLHLYHILIDRSFQQIEQDKFQPMLRSMTKILFEDSIKKYNSTSDEKLKESYKRLAVYYLIPLVVMDAGSKSSQIDLNPDDYSTFAQYMEAVDMQQIKASEGDFNFSLDNKTYDDVELSDEVYSLAKSELELIQNAKGLEKSPLFTPLRPEFENDYSQFKPRSHYTKNDILKSYFIAMMWYGRMGFVVKSPELTRDALIMTGQINNLKVGDKNLSRLWSDMMAVIDFFVGEVDDLTAYEYSPLIKDIYGDDISDIYFTDNVKLNEFIARAKAELPKPKIVSEALSVFDDAGQRDALLADTMQFRFMGQRFTPDAYVINNLTQGVGTPDPETVQMLPTMPTALMVFNVVSGDNEVVKDYLDKWINNPERIKKQDRESDKIIAKVINKLQQEFLSYTSETWTKNIYWSWLNCFRPLLSKYGEGYPYFMQSDSWMNKNLGTVLGSFTELKHDTLLYAKQSYAEFGGGEPDNPELPPVVKGYVEPDLEFWNRLITLAETTQTGLEDRNVFPSSFKNKYKTFIDSAKFLRGIVEQELQNKEISDDDFEKLRTISLSLYRITDPIGGQELTDKEKRAGIIADIHTDAVNQEILYEATGKPFIIYVAVKDANGARLTRGAVFNHYEFADKLDERLSDEDWQSKVYEGSASLPSGDEWTADLVK